MPQKTKITLSLIAPHYSREYASPTEAAAFWRAADSLLRACGAQSVRIVTQFGETILSRTANKGQEMALRYKALNGRDKMGIVGVKGGFLPILHRGEAMDVVLMAAARTEPARMMGELAFRRAA